MYDTTQPKPDRFVTIKRRSPWGVWLLSIVTLGIYFLIWYYNINRELADAGRRVSPAGALLALTLGAFLVIPPFVSIYNTTTRIRETQRDAGQVETHSGGLSVLLYVLFWLNLPYQQAHLNTIPDGTQVEGGVSR